MKAPNNVSKQEKTKIQALVDKVAKQGLMFIGLWAALAIASYGANSMADSYHKLRCSRDWREHYLVECPPFWLFKEMAAPIIHLTKELGSFGVTWRIALWAVAFQLMDIAFGKKTEKIKGN